MKTHSRIRNVIVAAVSAVAIVTALVFAMAQPKPQETPPFHLTIRCANGTVDTATNILKAIDKSPSLKDHPERHNLRVDDKPIGGGTMPIAPDEPPCGAHFTANVTQHAVFLKSSDLKKFLNDAAL
jgi:hypothetical protein